MDAIQGAVAARGRALIVLTGGGNGIGLMKHLRTQGQRINWSKVHLFWGDERYVPEDDDERNEKQARAALLDHVEIPSSQVHPMAASDGEFGDDLAAARAVLSRAAAFVDQHDAGSVEELFAEAQAAKAFVNEAGARVVDRALAISGGAGYRNGSPLARAYRDVKAAAFMHPLGVNRAHDYLGHVALGEPAPLH